MFKLAGRSDVGQKRSNNQDSILVSEKLALFAVADGMGGHSGGEVASSIAVKTLEKFFTEAQLSDFSKGLEAAVKLCNRAIQDFAQAQPQLKGMGTTLTAAVLKDQTLYVGHVGDSRCYLFSEGNFFQLTEDHSQVYEMLKAGLISESDLNLVQKNVITRSVGYEQDVNVDVFSRPVKKGDKYLICSDGLSGMVPNEDIVRILANFDLDQCATHLVDLANLNGGEDNVSVVLMEVM